jgi:hypothetical protein
MSAQDSIDITVLTQPTPEGADHTVRAAVVDGTAFVAIGSFAAGFGTEAIKTFVAEATGGRWWFVGFALGGVICVLYGFRRRRAARRALVGIAVTAEDPRLPAERGRHLRQQAVNYARERCAVAFTIVGRLADSPAAAQHTTDEIAAWTVRTMRLAEGIAPPRSAIALIPTMPLHAAFRFGARLGYTHARQVTVHALRQQDGDPAHFPAVTLRASDAPGGTVVSTGPVEPVPGATQPRIALALDLQARGEGFFDPVRTACQRDGIGLLLPVRTATRLLTQDERTYSGVVQQVCQAWQNLQLSAATRSAPRAVFLSGPVAIAVALGARLAANEPTRWIPYFYDGDTGAYLPWQK